MHQNLAIILQQFNYGKNSFIVLITGSVADAAAGGAGRRVYKTKVQI